MSGKVKAMYPCGMVMGKKIDLGYARARNACLPACLLACIALHYCAVANVDTMSSSSSSSGTSSPFAAARARRLSLVRYEYDVI
jgi:hypothetical protein